MAPIYCFVVAVVVAVSGSRFSYSWPWYACAAILAAIGLYAYLQTGHLLPGYAPQH